MITFLWGFAAGAAIVNARDATTNGERAIWIAAAIGNAMVPLVPHIMRWWRELEERTT